MINTELLEWNPGSGFILELNDMDSGCTIEKTPSQEYITYICKLYNNIYDDRVENTCPPTAGNTPCNPGED